MSESRRILRNLSQISFLCVRAAVKLTAIITNPHWRKIMKRYLVTLAIVGLLGVAGVSSAYARGYYRAGPGGYVYGPGPRGAYIARPGFAYSVPRAYRGWAYASWYGRYGTYLYYQPSNRLWYYWYRPGGYYLPASYLAAYPPQVVSGPSVAINYVPTGAPTPPDGATLLPAGVIPTPPY
jgi:hypothetical protein